MINQINSNQNINHKSKNINQFKSKNINQINYFLVVFLVDLVDFLVDLVLFVVVLFLPLLAFLTLVLPPVNPVISFK